MINVISVYYFVVFYSICFNHLGMSGCEKLSENCEEKQYVIKCDSIPKRKTSSSNDPIAIYHTNVDLDYNGKTDLIVSFMDIPNYGGPEYIIDSVYIKVDENCFKLDTLFPFCGDSYPSFFLNKQKITTFCIFKDSGYGAEYLWKNSKWLLNKEFTVKNNGAKSKWKVNNKIDNSSIEIIAPYNYYPPENVVEVEEKYKTEMPVFWE